MTINNIDKLLAQDTSGLKKLLHEDESMLNFDPLGDEEKNEYTDNCMETAMMVIEAVSKNKTGMPKEEIRALLTAATILMRTAQDEE